MTTRTTQRELERRAGDLAKLLRERSLRIVFAESCTGGLVSASLTGVPGVSEYHCGSAVVYRLATKSEWLGIATSLLEGPGPVSAAVAEAMAINVLARTPEADLAVSVTGHLGPDAPPELDGVIYVAVTRRGSTDESVQAEAIRVQLNGTAMPGAHRRRVRRTRQREAAVHVFETAINATRRFPRRAETPE